jgi:hypothetical protein
MAAHKGQPTGKCTVCAHLERTRIELLVLGGASQRSVGRKYGLSHHALCRHFANHISEERKANLILGPVQRMQLASRVAEESSSVLDHFKAIRAGLYSLFDIAVTAGDGSTGALVGGRLTEVNGAIGRLTGQLAQSPLMQINQTNVFLQDPGFASFQADLIRVLSRFPDARDAVLAEFERVESTQLPALEHCVSESLDAG